MRRFYKHVVLGIHSENKKFYLNESAELSVLRSNVAIVM